MERLIEHVNIQVEELQSYDSIQWDSIKNALVAIQEQNPSLSDSLVNLFEEIKRHYLNDMLKAKNIYEEKAKQFELVNARLQLNEIEGNYRNHEKTQMNEEEEIDEEDIIGKLSDQFNENEMIFSDQNSIHGFNFPINNENTISMFTEMAGSTSISDCICFEIGDSSEHANIEVQKECDDLNMINELIYQNNQYLKLAASWKKQCQAIMMKMEEMKKGNYNEKNKEKMNTPLDKKLNL